ncbi:MAG: PAS domain-containing protein, partial [Gallionella sp.]|nr:PAS domain-containing protein [Gallionella sp.]
MPGLDIRTLSFLAMISSLLLAVGLQLVNRLITRDPSLRLWALGASVSAAGYVLFAVRGIVPDLLSIVVGNTLLVIGTAWLYLGNRSFRGLKNEFPWYWLLAAATAAVLCYFTYLMPSLSARIITLSAALAMVLLPSAFVWLHPGDSADRMVRWFVGAASLVAALLLGMRAVMTPFMVSPGQDFMAVASPVHTLTLVMGISLNIVLGIGLPLLVSGRLQRRVMESEERFRTIADYTFGWEYWLGTHDELLYVNAACERISGYSQAEFGADPRLIKRIVHAEDRPVYEEHLHHIDAQQETHIEFRIVTKKGEVRWIAHGCRAVFSPDGRPLGRRISNRDITDLKNAEEHARQLAFFDSLTNLPNRRMLVDRLNHGLSQARRFGRPLAVMFLDL